MRIILYCMHNTYCIYVSATIDLFTLTLIASMLMPLKTYGGSIYLSEIVIYHQSSNSEYSLTILVSASTVMYNLINNR